jgi:hypothetical protein
MSTTITGDLHGLDTKDKSKLYKAPKKYKYTVSASGGGKLRFKVKYYTGDQYSPNPGDGLKGKWRTLIKREKVDSGASLSGSFDLPQSQGGQPTTELKWPIQQRSATWRFLALKKTSRGVR